MTREDRINSWISEATDDLHEVQYELDEIESRRRELMRLRAARAKRLAKAFLQLEAVDAKVAA